ncbi:MAG: Adenylate cyclase [Acidimicrobiales bacterium]|nr:Adenylate cyclase [Acidimicrobiales bacterium]
MVANLGGVAVVISYISWVLPGAHVEQTARLIALNAILGGVFLVVVLPAGIWWGETWLGSGRRWLQEGRPPTDREVTAVLRAPMRLFLVHVTLWLVAAALFAVLNALIEFNLLARVAFTVTLGGFTTSAFAYLVAERVTRPIAAAALSVRTVERPKLPGITARTMFGWGLGTGVPFVGLVITAIFALADDQTTRKQLAVTMLVLGGTGLVVGSWIAVLGAKAVADPIRSLRTGIRGIADGRLDSRVEVYDGSVLGLLQAGFNDMATGLEERERLRDLYGRQVGEDVARDVLERGSQLGGRLCDVAVLFVDVVGSTQIAASRPAEEVVELLNRFFGVVVDEVHAHGGWVNKFQGDATLVVFGAPVPLDDAADRALAAGRNLARRLPAEVPELAAGIGVAYGEVVAGNIGDERRFEFTVIGDPVNEAARLTELAKTRTPMVLASADAVDAARLPESACWVVSGSAELRGRSKPTRLATPVAPQP